MSEIEIFDSSGQKVVDATSGSIRVGNLSKNRKMKKWMMKNVFEIKEKGRKFEYISYFRASRYDGGRAEQFIAVYKGEPESPAKFAEQIQEVMRKADEKSDDNIFHSFSKDKRNFLAKFAETRTKRPRNYRERKIKRELEGNQKINFKAPNTEKAARVAKWIEKLELDSKDSNFSLSVVKKKSFSSEVNIYIDKSAKAVKPMNKEAKKAQTNQVSTSSRVNNKPSGPGEWVKSKIPFI